MFSFFKKPKAPALHDVIDAHRALAYTPDAPLLETKEAWTVLVYDDLQAHHPRHHKLLSVGGINPNGKKDELIYAYSLDSFVMWKFKDKERTFPVIVDNAPSRFGVMQEWDTVSPYRHHIKGQLWNVGYQGIIELDEHYRNTVEFERRALHLVYIYAEEIVGEDGGISVSMRKEYMIQAFVYVGIQKFWDQHMDGRYVPVKVFPRRDHLTPPYYFFTKKEYDQ